jgi:glyoxylate utilization-related uncharacterized protein
MSYFFAEPARHTLSITRKAHLQGNGRTVEPVQVTPLNAVSENPRLLAQMIEFPATGVASGAEAFRQMTGLVYVLEGQLQLDAGGMQETLEAGDCAYIQSEMALAWSAAGKLRCRVLAVLPGAQTRAQG